MIDDLLRDDLTRLTLALSTFKSERGTYPATLAELQPAFLEPIPIDVFSNAPLKYSRTAAGYTLYSVGPNMTDDGGKSEGRADDVVASVP